MISQLIARIRQNHSGPSYPNLLMHIIEDMWESTRYPLLLLSGIFVCAVLVVVITAHTREAVTAHDELSQQREHLENEWRNLVLEENALSEHSRIQTVAIKKLGMMMPDAAQEIDVKVQNSAK